jgi:predicted RNA methylase
MTNAEQAYKDWQGLHKVSMMVHTNQQMFEIGFNTAQEIIKELSDTILVMEKDAKKMNSIIQKLKKEAKEK